ncbi:MAG: bifunctional DNA-binding transcriptional regulator/O6-methylguanine-DNA methyltransferase Ada [Rhodospirillales bacterium]|nr:bifunctional DNA-binding transcriptional regulator/O6-methylguanine-DNA methyltransferase Ada [Rhodospirillales bacterium]
MKADVTCAKTHDGPAEHDPRWAAVVSRDPSADGTFCYSVSTTGVYCRPSCAARRANPRNVRFHACPADAEAAGFRPCKRCTPDQPPLAARWAAVVANACRAIENAEEPVTLSGLADAAGLSPWHFHRVFKAMTGLTPRGYARAHRSRSVRNQLTGSNTVTEAIYQSGFGSNSRFYETSEAVLGMTPGAFRLGGDGEEIRFAVGDCSLGVVLVAGTAKGICAIFLGDDPDALLRDLRRRFSRARILAGDGDFQALVAAVIALVEAPGTGLSLPLDVRGTVFQQRVWETLRTIPCGSTASYTEIAQRLGTPKSARAVAQACAANPVAVAIPCHRVVRSDESLAGYRWGVERKCALLERESASASVSKGGRDGTGEGPGIEADLT